MSKCSIDSKLCDSPGLHTDSSPLSSALPKPRAKSSAGTTPHYPSLSRTQFPAWSRSSSAERKAKTPMWSALTSAASSRGPASELPLGVEARGPDLSEVTPST